jgi:hypothetical protein
MSKISEKLNIINNAKNDIKTSIENKGVSVGDIGIQEYAGKIDEMKIATPVTKGIVINAYDSNGYATDISIVGMTSIPNYAFASSNSTYSNLLNKKLVNVNLPDNITSIGRYSFAYCQNLLLEELPNTITAIGSTAFIACTKLELNELPTGISKIESSTFSGCSNLALTSLPESVTSIDGNAFQNCGGLLTMKLPSLVTNLQGGLFYGCTNLTEVTCNATNINNQVFQQCSSLSKFVLPNITKVSVLQNTNAFASTPIASGTGYIYVPDDLVSSFQTASNWSTYASQIKGVSEL